MPAPRLYYIRHGETAWNAAGRFQGSRDIPLNELGQAQAGAAGRILHDLLLCEARQPDSLAYVASPMVRARVTMDLVRTALGLPPEGYRLDDRLKEIRYGDWEGLTAPEMKSRDPELYAAREVDKWEIASPAGESYAELTQRVRAWYGELRADTLAVAHGGTMRALLVILGLASPQDASIARIEQGVVYLFADGAMTRYS